MQFETINGLIPFELKGDQGKFEDTYMPYFIEKGLSEKDALDVVSSIWLFANDQWYKGKEYGEHNSVAGEFVEAEDNYVPDVVADPYRRKHIRHRFNIKQGQTREQVQTELEQYIKEYIEKNTIYHSPNAEGFPWHPFKPISISNPYPREPQPPEPAVLPSIQVEKQEANKSLEELIIGCKTRIELVEYKLIASMNPRLSEIFYQKDEELIIWEIEHPQEALKLYAEYKKS